MKRKKARERTILGRWSLDGLEQMLRTASGLEHPPGRIDFVSRQFLGVPYGASTLAGSPVTPEILVIDLREVDCFTYIDYVEAMRLSRSFGEFREHLRQLRYRAGAVAYKTRRHFFTDWLELPNVKDVTREIGRNKTKDLTKLLNRKFDGSPILEGIPVVEREIAFVTAGLADAAALNSLQTGDYLGIYSEKEGLDVSHVGIAVRDGEAIRFRHASAVEQRVVDQDLGVYLRGKPGFIVLRPT